MSVPPFLAVAAAAFLSLATGLAAEPIPLRIDWPSSGETGAFPVYCGLSLPKSAVEKTAQVHVEDAAGHAVAAEVEPLARWTPESTLKWVGLHFLAERGVSYRAVIGPATDGVAGLKVSESPQAIVIETGKVKVELPKRGPLIGRVELGGVTMIAGESACLLVTDQTGRVADETHDQASGPKLEYAGQQLAVVRREGFLLTAQGERLGKYVIRLEFLAGSGVVKMQHTFINTENTDQLQYADLSVRLRPVTAAQWKVAIEPAPGAAPLQLTLDPAAGDATYLLQAEYPHHGQKTSRRELMVRRGHGEFAPVAVTSEPVATAGNWAAVQSAAGGLLMAVPKLARLFPKELEVSADGLTAHLWSSRGGRLLDYRPATLVDYWGAAWADKSFPGGSAAMRKVDANAQGTSRTHDLWLAFVPPTSAVAPLGTLCATPPACVQDPQWMRKTEALGFVHPYDPEHFPALEKFVHYFIQEYLVGQQERWGDYGFLDLGCGAHYYQDSTKLPGEEMPKLNRRYSDNLYHAQTALWEAYARSGDRMYLDYTQDFHRHLADFKFAHAPGPNRQLDSRIGGLDSEDNPYYWNGSEGRFGGGMCNGHQGFDAEGFLLQRYLTGDRWGEECIVKSGKAMLARFKPEVLPEIGANSDAAQPFLTAAPLYLHTGDARYLAFLDKVRARVVNLQTITAWADPDYYGAWAKYHIMTRGTLADYLATDSPLSREAIVKAFRIMLWDAPENTTGYHEQNGLFANYGWRLTGNLRYASYIEELFNRVLFEYQDAAGNPRHVTAAHGGPHSGGTHNFQFIETAFYGMDLLAETEGKRQPYLALDAGPACQPVEFHFAKGWHEPLDFELRHTARPDLEVTWSPGGETHPARDIDTGPVHWDDYPNYYDKEAPGLGSGYTHLEMGAETVAGEYRLLNVPLLFTHNAKKLVLSAPDGLILRAIDAKPPTWFFQLPAGKKGAVYSNKPIEVRRAGQLVSTKPGEWTELAGGAADELLSLTASGLVFVNFRGGIPPVLAEHDPKLFFVPRVVQETMAAREQAPAPVLANERFQRGLAGQALLLSPGRSVKIPRGAMSAPGTYEFLHYDAGTLEFWFKPRWSTGSATKSGNLNFVFGAFWPCWLRQYAGDDQDPRSAAAFGFTALSSQVAPGPGPRAYPPQQLLNVTPVRGQQWHHFAVSWTTDPQRGWLSEMYVDGRPSLGWARHNTGLGRFSEASAPRYNPPLPWPIDEPAGEAITLVGNALDSLIDELRISRTARYPKAFAALPERKFEADDDTSSARSEKAMARRLPERKFEADDDTLLLLRFDGDTKPEGAGPEVTVSGK